LGVKVTMSGKAPTASDLRMFPVAASSSTTVPAFDLTCKRRRENPSLKRPESLVAPEQKCLGR
jgi:hypothetical protein